jgi:battenin
MGAFRNCYLIVFPSCMIKRSSSAFEHMSLLTAYINSRFWLLLQTPGSQPCTWKSVIDCSNSGRRKTQQSPSSASVNESETSTFESPQPLTLTEKFKSIPPLLTYMIPLGLVYLFEYFINQGLVSTITKRD